MGYSKLNPMALGMSLGILGGLMMVILSIAGLLGFAAEAVRIMADFHIGYSLTALGIVIGTAEGAVGSFVFGYLTAIFYNKFS